MSWNIIQFVHTIKFHSYEHDNVSFIEKVNNFHFSCYRHYSFRSCLKMLKISIGVKLDGEDEQGKKKEKRICLDETMVKKPPAYKYVPKYISGTTLER